MSRRVLLVIVLALALVPFGATACGGGEEVAPVAEGQETTGTATETRGRTGTETAGPTGTETETTAEESQPAAQGDPAAGKPIFTESCGGCHVLEEAGTQGTIGPNLDEAKPDYQEALEQIRNGGGGMPAFKDQLSEEQIKDVTAFVVQGSKGGGG